MQGRCGRPPKKKRNISGLCNQPQPAVPLRADSTIIRSDVTDTSPLFVPDVNTPQPAAADNLW
jgi:hypothetical protein